MGELHSYPLSSTAQAADCALYRNDGLAAPGSTVTSLIASTPQTRKITNDPFCFGVEYTGLLCEAVTAVLSRLQQQRLFSAAEAETSVLHILRGGLNFGLREALNRAYGWNRHGSAFISAQRARAAESAGDWVITESDYRKISLHQNNTIVFGDVVATGTSLEYALRLLGQTAAANQAQITSLLFFTIGSPRSQEILESLDQEYRRLFPSYQGSTVVYLEGIFDVANPESPLRIKINGTDLLRRGGVLTPEFLESQYSDPAFPLERCTIYDAGSRAFDIPEYLADVELYWKQVAKMAEEGLSFRALLQERCPKLDAARFGEIDLAELSKRQLSRMAALGVA